MSTFQEQLDELFPDNTDEEWGMSLRDEWMGVL
jgi:hypothetical protein